MRPTFRNETMFGARPDWSPEPSGDFPVEWPDPADAELAWERDEMHHPFALPPLAMDVAVLTNEDGLNAGFAYFDAPIRTRTKPANGYLYVAPTYGVPDDEVPALLAGLRSRYRDFGSATTAYWSDALPELLAIYDQMRSLDVDGLPPEAVADGWREAWRGMARVWGIHFVIIRGAYRISEDLADLYASIVPDAPTGTGYRLIQGGVDVLFEVDSGLERLAAIAAGAPDVAAVLRRDPPASLDDLAAVTGGPSFLTELRAFLGVHGHLGQTYSDVSEPSWAEDPGRVLSELANRLEHPPERADERRRRLRVEADELAEGAILRLADRPVERAEFGRLLALAREIGPLTETHNYWIDRMSHARLRTLATRVGRRLVRDGTIGVADDVLFLHRDEISDLLIAPRPMSPTVEERRAEFTRQQAITPPRAIGRVDGDRASVAARPDGAAIPPLVELRGTGASAGVVRGPARVTLTPEDFDRIGRGDIIVCPATNPTWVPVFAIAAGLVTNTGGILAHAAVVAREFGLPAVVGVAGATLRIPDGRVIEIDGTAGTVRLLESP
jgi:rifampicin phosphotransferase